VLLRDAAIAPRTVRGIAAERVDILVGAGRINAIEPPKTVPMGAAELTIDASRLLVLPGMINGHVHSWDHFLKGCLENLTTELFMAQIRPRTPVPLTERQIYLRTVIGAIESLRTGATTIIDLGFLYDSNGWDDDLPYWDATSGARPILVVPYALDTNDMKFYHPNGFVGGREFLDYLNCALDVLLRGRARPDAAPQRRPASAHLRPAGPVLGGRAFLRAPAAGRRPHLDRAATGHRRALAAAVPASEAASVGSGRRV
jgi:hypothetical protein